MQGHNDYYTAWLAAEKVSRARFESWWMAEYPHAALTPIDESRRENRGRGDWLCRSPDGRFTMELKDSAVDAGFLWEIAEKGEPRWGWANYLPRDTLLAWRNSRTGVTRFLLIEELREWWQANAEHYPRCEGCPRTSNPYKHRCRHRMWSVKGGGLTECAIIPWRDITSLVYMKALIE